ncbi:MFS transporter [Salinigranum halophilum]|uniref:MFS transporter n=1 Tax=Salinigranum halophilum TaxID=2565931 RepID=UPI00115D861B|nr:MFS transporter [Salinigranum halophilum]
MGRRGGETRRLELAPHAAAVSLGYVIFAYAAVPGSLTTRLSIDFASFGLLTSAALGAFVVSQPIASRLTDTQPTARLLRWALLLHVVLAVGLDFVTSFSTLLALRAAWGVVGGFVLSVGATQLARLHRGSATTRQQGVYGALLTLGGAVGFLVTPRLAEVAAATPGIGPIHAPGALLALPALGLLLSSRGDETTRPPEKTGDETSQSSDERVSVLTNPVVLLAAFVYVAIIGSFVTLSTFVTAYYTDLGIAGPLSALVLVVATAGRWVGGLAVANEWLTDATVILGGTAVAVVGFAALAAPLPTAVVLVFPLVAMVAVSLPFGAVYAVAARATPRDGAALAVVVAAGNVGSIVLPAATGAARDLTGGYGVGFLALAGLNLLALGGAVVFRRRLTARPRPA